MALLAFYPLMIMAIVWAGAFSFGYLQYYDRKDLTVDMALKTGNAFIVAYWPLILAFVVIWFVIAWFTHTKMVRRLARSHPVTRKEEPELYNLLENLCISKGMPMPRLEIIESHARNAFASGIDTKSFSITVTRGLLSSLTTEEVEAVLAHELTHIENRDVRLVIISIIFTGMIGILTQMAWSSLRHIYWVPRSRNNRNSGAIIVFIVIIALILAVGYGATLLTRFALSRRREYMADAGAVAITKNPAAMMSALKRISRHERIPAASEDIALMYTHNSKPFIGLFATHPPIDKRIRIISETTGTPVPEISAAPAGQKERFGEANMANPWTRQRRRQ
jgi:heat shock protein HtpX